MKKKVLIIACHPDDEILGCGGFLDKYKNQYKFKVIFLAEGSSCRYKDKVKYELNINRDIASRQNSAIKALKLFSISDVSFFNHACGQLNKVPQTILNKIIEDQIQIFRPNIVFTHSNKDLNLDHQTIVKSVLVATRPTSIKNIISEIYSFEILSSTEWNFLNKFKPNYFVSMSKKNILNKWNALKCYKSEIQKKPHPRSLFGIETLAKYRGLQCGSNFAESYEIIRSFKK
jgi:LmbE family N-acetylglucosaminyl deacetylase